jgi:hypothetical protein
MAFRWEKMHKHFVEVGVVGTTVGVVGCNRTVFCDIRVGVVGITAGVAGCNRIVFCEVRVGVSTREDV